MPLSTDVIYTEEQLFSRLKVDGLIVDEKIIEKARDSDPEALFRIGETYYNQLNYTTSKIWFSKSAALNNANAQSRLGFIYQNGLGVTVDHSIAHSWFLKATEQGHTEAEVYIGDDYFYGNGIPVNKKVALEWYFKAAVKENSVAMEKIANALTAENKKQSALFWYQKSMNLGNDDSKKGLDKLNKEKYHLEIDQRTILNIEERLHCMEREKTSRYPEHWSIEMKNITTQMENYQKKLDEANKKIANLEKQNEENLKNFEKSTRRLKKKISSLEKNGRENVKLEDKIAILESAIDQSKHLVYRIKWLEALIGDIKSSNSKVSDNANESILSCSCMCNSETNSSDLFFSS